MLAAQQQKPPIQPSSGKTHTGTVTKLLDNFGFIDDSIFFPLSVIKGVNVKLGDKVYYECTYSKNLPFNWNATLVQLAPPGATTGPPPGSSGGGGPPPPQQQSQQQSYPMHQQQQQPSPQQHPPAGNYSGPPGHSSYQPPSGANGNSVASNYYHSQSKGMQPSQQQPPPQSYPPYQSSYGNAGQGPPPPQTQQQQQQPPPGQQPFPDMAQVQKAVAAVSQLQSQYYPGSGAPKDPRAGGANAHQGPPPPNANIQQQHPVGLGPNGPPRGGPPPPSSGGPYGQIQYTSTPGSAFINSPQQYQPQPGPPQHMQQGPPGPPNRGGPPQGPGGPGPMGGGPPPRWGDPREDRYDPRRPGGPQGGPPGPCNRFDGPPPGPGNRFDGPPPGNRFDGPPPGPGNRFDGPPPGPGNRFDGPPPGSGGRFDGPPPGRGPKSRFDSDSRFGPSIPVPPPPPPQKQQQQAPPPTKSSESRFGPPPSNKPSPSEIYRSGAAAGAPAGRDEFGRDRKEESRFGPPVRAGGGDKERDAFRNDIRGGGEKENDSVTTNDSNDKRGGGGGGRNDRRNDRKRDNRSRPMDKKRSISPARSVASSSGEASRGDISSRTVPTGLSKRRYEGCNIPKNMILRNRYSAHELKSRISKSVHIPSDLKEVLFNVDADLDLLDIPKPITYKIMPMESKEKDGKGKEKEKEKERETKSKDSKKSDTKPTTPVKKSDDKVNTKESTPVKTNESKDDKTIEETKGATTDTVTFTVESTESVKEPTEESSATPLDSQSSVEVSSSAEQQQPSQEETEPRDMEIDEESSSAEFITPLIETNVPLEAISAAVLQSQTKIAVEPVGVHHKYNVKVLLIGLPSLADIYTKVIGPDFDSVNSNTSKNSVHLNKLFSVLVFRNADSGYSMIGGKWVLEKDGLLPGSVADQESPNLIATAIRVTYEQTGLNLSRCRQWKVFSTFIYNRDTNLDANNSGYEITKIYLPDIWSTLDSIYAPIGEVEKKEDKPIVFEEVVLEEEEEKVKPETPVIELSGEPQVIEQKPVKEEEPMEPETSVETAVGSVVAALQVKEEETKMVNGSEEIEEPEDKPDREYLENVLENLDNLKVADLRAELEKLGQKVEGRPRKDQLATRLRDYVNEQLETLNEPEPEAEAEEVNDFFEEEETKTQDTTITLSSGATGSAPVESTPTQATPEIEEIKLEDEEAQVNGLVEEKTQPESQSEASKRKLDESEAGETAPSEAKKPKTEESAAVEEKKKEGSISAVGSCIKVKGSHLAAATLSGILNPHRFDQFELSVIGELLRDSLVVHFARYILSALLHNAETVKNQCKAASTNEKRVIEVNYVHLAFSYFDKGHAGHMPLDDLLCLLNCTGFPLSRKVFNALTNNEARLVYRDFSPPTTLIPRYIEYPSVSMPPTATSTTSVSVINGPLIVERNYTQYNIDELIKQSEADQKLKVRLNEELASSTSKVGHLEAAILELETKQKKMSAATGRQNDELCAVKREKDQLKAKYEALRKMLEKTASTLTETLKQYQPVSSAPIVTSLGATDNATINLESDN